MTSKVIFKAAIFSTFVGMSSHLLAQPIEFKGIAFGASLEQVQEQFKGAVCQAGWKPCEVFSIMDGLYSKDPSVMTYGGAKAKSIRGHMIQGGVEMFLIETPTDSFEQVASAMVARFGRPTRDERSSIQNRLGAVFEQRSIYWAKPDGAITASKYGASLDVSSYVLASKRWIEHQSRARDSAAAAGSKDL